VTGQNRAALCQDNFVLFRRLFREEFIQQFLHRPGSRKQVQGRNAQCAGEAQQFVVGHTSNLGLDLRERAPADVPSLEPDARRQLGLSQIELIPQLPDFRSDDVLSGFAAHAARSCRFRRV
jgi:hypothetical protein